MQSVYLANQTYLLPTDIFTQEQNIQRPLLVQDPPQSFFLLRLVGKSQGIVYQCTCFEFHVSVNLPVFSYLSLSAPLSFFFFPSFVIGVINGGRGGLAWRPVFQWPIKRCSTA